MMIVFAWLIRHRARLKELPYENRFQKLAFVVKTIQ